MKSKKYWVLTLPLAIIIIIVLYNMGNKPQKPEPEPKPDSQLEEDVTDIKDELTLFIENDFNIDEPKTYHNKIYNFSVDYPGNWEVLEEDSTASDSPDGDPQNGILIYVENNKNDWIYVFGQVGPISTAPEKQTSEFTTSDGATGTITYDQYDGRVIIFLVLGDDYYGASINIDENVFANNKQQILGILKSIQLKASN